ERKRIFSHDGQLTSALPYIFTAETDNPLSPDHSPGEIYFVVQMLWRKDSISLIPFDFRYWCDFYWVTYIYDLDLSIPPKNMQIYDDDTEPPIIPTETAIPLPFNPIKIQPVILDNLSTFPLEVCAYDQGVSGPHPANWITFGDFNVYDGEYLSDQDELIELNPLGNNKYAYWYRYNIPNDFEPGMHTVELKVWDRDNDGWPGDTLSASIDVHFMIIDDDTIAPEIHVSYTGDGTDGNPGQLMVIASDASGLSVDPSGIYPVPSSLGTHQFIFTATDNDNDRPNDALTYTVKISIEIVDDDTTAPNINIIYTGDGTDGNPGELMVTASDASGLSVDPTGNYPVPSSLGTHQFSFTATDNDNDRPNDALSNTVETSIDIVDDDTTEPYFENIIVTHDSQLLNISFDGLDIPEGDDLGLSIIEVYVDDVLIYTYYPTSIENTFNFSLNNQWLFEKGVHDVRVRIVDADNDRADDALSNEFTSTFEITLADWYDYVIWQLEGLKNYVDENLEGILSWAVRFLLWMSQDALRDAYNAFLADRGVSGLVKDKFAQALTHISEFLIDIFNYWDLISDEYVEYIIPNLHLIRNNIIWLMGESVGVEQSKNIASIEIELFNLIDFVDDNINHTDSFVLKLSLAGAIVHLEGALFKIVLDLNTECMLTGTQVALDHALTEVDNLLNSGKITQELADSLKSEILQIQVEIEMVKNSS
ncbi:MAG: hypothetical protein ACFFCI_23690, partial [Promethearchaeota archaeon]